MKRQLGKRGVGTGIEDCRTEDRRRVSWIEVLVTNAEVVVPVDQLDWAWYDAKRV